MRLTNKDYKDKVGKAFDELVFLANINPNDVCKFPVKNLREQELKLGQLEDIEEELGIDLIILFKALKNGIWVKYDADFGFTGKPKIVIEKDKCTEICLRKKKWWIQENDFLLKDYGKTWALTKEELL